MSITYMYIYISYLYVYMYVCIMQILIIAYRQQFKKKQQNRQMQAWQLLSSSKTITIHTSQGQISKPSSEYNPHRGIVNCAVYNHTGKVIASCGQDGKIALHSAQRCQDQLLQLPYYTGQEEPSSINCCLFSPKSKFIAAGSVNSTVKVWDMKSNKQKQALHKLRGHAGGVTSLAWINNQEIIASSSTSGDILLHDIGTGAIRDSLTSRFQQGINSIKVSQGEAYKRLAACTNSGSILVWDINISTKKPIYTYQDISKNSFTSLSISSFSPVLMVSSSISSNLVFMDINQRKVIKNVATQQSLTSIAFNQDGQILAAGGMSGALYIYDLRKIQTPLYKLYGHDTPIKSVCFSQKDKDKDKVRGKEKEYSVSSGLSRTSTITVEDKDKDKNKVLAPVVSTNKLQTVEDKDKSRVRNLAVKKQQPQPTVQTLSQNTSQPPPQIPKPPQQQPRPQTTSTYIPQPQPQRPTTTSTTYSAPYSHPNYYAQSQIVPQNPPSSTSTKYIQDKLMQQMKNMEIRMNQKFQVLHLEIIRQMQMSVEKMERVFEKRVSKERDLEEKIRMLQEENQNLKKRTF